MDWLHFFRNSTRYLPSKERMQYMNPPNEQLILCLVEKEPYPMPVALIATYSMINESVSNMSS